MRRALNADTHALKQHRLSQNMSPVCPSFVLVIQSDMHLESKNEKRAKNVHFHTTKNIQIQSTLFFLTTGGRRGDEVGIIIQHRQSVREVQLKVVALRHMN